MKAGAYIGLAWAIIGNLLIMLLDQQLMSHTKQKCAGQYTRRTLIHHSPFINLQFTIHPLNPIPANAI